MVPIMEELAKLFGGMARVKVMRLFLFNPDTGFDIDDIVERSKIISSVARKELSLLESISFITKKDMQKVVEKKRGGKVHARRVTVTGYFLNKSFAYIDSLRLLLLDSGALYKDELPARFKNGGKIRLLITSGVFLGRADEGRLDLFIVGDYLKRGVIENTIKTIESEIGKELRYAIFDTKEYDYRLGMYDKLVRDVIDFPHERLVEKIKVG